MFSSNRNIIVKTKHRRLVTAIFRRILTRNTIDRSDKIDGRMSQLRELKLCRHKFLIKKINLDLM